MGETAPSGTAEEHPSQMSRAGTCLMFFPDGYVGVAPTVKNLAEVLAEAGLTVSILGWLTPFPPPARLDPSVRIRAYRRPWDLPVARTVEMRLHRRGLHSLVAAVELGWFLIRSIPTILGTLITRAPRAIIGVDTIGSIVANLASATLRRPFAYLSLELPSSDEAPVARLLRRLEGGAIRRADFVAIQDADRLGTLNRILNIDHPRPMLLPNAPRGSATSTVESSNNLLRERLGISQVDYPVLVLHAGMIEDATYCRELAAAFVDVGHGRALVLHERVARSSADRYLTRLKELNSKNLFLSVEPVDIDDLDALFKSASIGLVLYRDISPNFSQIAKASGKMAYYMKHGIPVIANDVPSLAQFVSENGVGVVIRDPADPIELRGAVDDVLATYDTFSDNARRVFNEQLDFDVLSRPVVARLCGSATK